MCFCKSGGKDEWSCGDPKCDRAVALLDPLSPTSLVLVAWRQGFAIGVGATLMALTAAYLIWIIWFVFR